MDKKMILKVVTGIVVVPVSIIAHKLWPWWMKASMPTKVISGIFVLPIVGLAALLTPWWDGF